jgi:hypothetical protein
VREKWFVKVGETDLARCAEPGVGNSTKCGENGDCTAGADGGQSAAKLRRSLESVNAAAF